MPNSSGEQPVDASAISLEMEHQDRVRAACVASAREAWQYVTAMHAAAVGGPRAPIRGIVEDVEDMRVRLTRERDEARALAAELEKRLERQGSLVASLAHQLSARRRQQALIPMVPWPDRPRALPPR